MNIPCGWWGEGQGPCKLYQSHTGPHQFETRPSNRALARRTSALFEPGYDPYNSALHHARTLSDQDLIEWSNRVMLEHDELPPILQRQAE